MIVLIHKDLLNLLGLRELHSKIINLLAQHLTPRDYISETYSWIIPLRYSCANVLGNVYLSSLTKNLEYEEREQLDSGGGGALSQGATELLGYTAYR